MKKLFTVSAALSLAALSLTTTSCVPLAVGAVGGYMIADDGVRLQSPITKKPRYQAPPPQQEYHY